MLCLLWVARVIKWLIFTASMFIFWKKKEAFLIPEYIYAGDGEAPFKMKDAIFEACSNYYIPFPSVHNFVFSKVVLYV